MGDPIRHPGSFRDPAGFVFRHEGILYRQVNESFRTQFEKFEQSGACREFIEKSWLIPHEKLDTNLTGDPSAAFFLRPQEVPFISYPYEWSFDMLRDAALLTLQLAENSVNRGLQLKDATPYNIQWLNGKPVFIDSLSFEPLKPGPWVAYRQFCEAFLAPLLIMHYTRQHLPELYRAWPDGIPLPVASRLLPWRSRFSVHTYLHIHLQAKLSEKKSSPGKKGKNFGTTQLQRILLSLKTLIQSLRTPASATVWSGYYEEATTRGDYLEAKLKLATSWIEQMNGLRSAIDLGANEGLFSKLLADRNIPVIAADIDPECVNRLYIQSRSAGETGILPLVQDLAVPSPGLGVNNQERMPFLERAHADLALVLALIHHLALQKRMDFQMIRDLLLPIAPNVILEFVPTEDEKAALLLKRIEGIRPEYSRESFEVCFGEKYEIHRREIIAGSCRTLYWLIRK